MALGPVQYESHAGERPMGLTWKLDVPMPAALFEKFAGAVGGLTDLAWPDWLVRFIPLGELPRCILRW